jgi:phosphoribosyl-dephospho-CoA transferase
MKRRMAPSRVSGGRVLEQLKTAARTGDRAALTLAVDQMRTLAYSPRYWEKYLTLLAHPLARLVDLLVIKQGEKIARQKGWAIRRRRAAAGRQAAASPPRRRRGGRAASPLQPSLFPDA